jgi:two-component sensor histidine kinase
VRLCKDGRLIDISLSVSPLVNAEGKIIAASKIARDITERKRAAAAKEMLTKEMSHRLKNTFAVFNSIVAVSAHSSPTPEAMARQIRERITALALAHDLTRPGLVGAVTESSSPTTFHALARAIFAPYVQPSTRQECERIILKGVDLPLAQRSMTNWAFVKYGSLSSAQGWVEIELTMADGKLLMSWKEKGGPPLNGPSDQEGFGSVLARQIIIGHFGGQLSYRWNAHGLLVRASIPQDRLASAEEASPLH